MLYELFDFSTVKKPSYLNDKSKVSSFTLFIELRISHQFHFKCHMTDFLNDFCLWGPIRKLRLWWTLSETYRKVPTMPRKKISERTAVNL